MSLQDYDLIKLHMDKGATFLEALYIIENERKTELDQPSDKTR